MKYLLLLPLLLVGCQTTQAPAPVVAQTTSSNPYAGSGVSDPKFKLPEGAGCRGALAKFKAVMENDLETGHTTKGVFERVMSDLNPAEAACAAGNDGGASAQVRGVRSKYGYPQG